MRRIFIYSLQQNMKNKNLSLKWILVAVAVGFMSMWYCSAITNFHFNIEAVKAIQESLLDDIMPIHFADNWNDFGGFFYFSNGLGNESEWGIPSEPSFYYKCVYNDGENKKEACVSTGSKCEDLGWDLDNTAYEDEECKTQFQITTDSEIDEYQYEVSMNDNSYICSRQVKWYYYNAERWERLWPLDGETWSDVVETTWWFYTMCKKEWYIDELKNCLKDAKENAKNYYDCKDKARKDFATDGDGYYGSIKHVFSGQELNLIAWVKYDPTTKFTSIDANAGFSPTFIRFGNKYPLWFIYDNNGGVWFVWCQVDVVSAPNSMKTLIREYNTRNNNKKPNPLDGLFKDDVNGTVKYGWAQNNVGITCTGLSWDSLIWVVIEWIVWMWEVWNTADFEVIWNQKDDKMQYFSSANINNNTIINYARKKAELLCRWKWKSNTNTSESIVCVDNPVNGKIELNSPAPNHKTYIVKNWNVEIKPSENAKSTDYYDIFIDSWNLIINETESTPKFVIKNNGFVSLNGTSSPKSPSDFNRSVLFNYSGFKIGSQDIQNCIDYLPTIKGICTGMYEYSDDDIEDSYLECMAKMNDNELGACLLNWWIDAKAADLNGDWKIDQGDVDSLSSTDNALCTDEGSCDAAVASIIKWNFIVNWNIMWPEDSSNPSLHKKLNNKYFIYWKLSSRDSFQTLQDTFAWRCNNWYTTDGSYCLPSNASYNNPYEDAFLVVIDQNYENSPFFSAS